MSQVSFNYNRWVTGQNHLTTYRTRRLNSKQRRQETTGIKRDKLQIVDDLLKQLERVVESIPAVDMDISLRRLQVKIDNVALVEEKKEVEKVVISSKGTS